MIRIDFQCRNKDRINTIIINTGNIRCLIQNRSTKIEDQTTIKLSEEILLFQSTGMRHIPNDTLVDFG